MIPLHMHGGGPMGPAGHHMMGPLGMLFGALQCLALLALIAFVVLMFAKRGGIGPVRWVGAGRPGQPGRPGPRPRFFAGPEDEALHTLRMRLANGDITTDEFLERSAVLAPKGTTPPQGA